MHYRVLYKGFLFVKLFNPILYGPLRCCSQMWGQKGLLPKNLSHLSYNDEPWHSYTSSSEDSKNI